MKKIIVFIISAILCASAFCSCTPNGNESGNDPKETYFIHPVADKPPLFTD